MKSVQDTYTLNNGIIIPCVGFGTWQTPNDDVGYNAVLEAIKAGYRHIDTAAGYGNEESVGKAIKDCGVPREEIFITTKLNNPMHGYELTVEAIETSLKLLGVDYIDLYLIHWPNPAKFRDCWEKKNAGSWKAMEEAVEAGKIKALGVSNFRIHHLEALYKTAKILPTVNQIKLCPGEHPTELIDYCTSKDILLEGYSPLGTGRIFEVPEMIAMAKEKNTTIAALSLKWSIDNGFLPLPKSVTPERIIANTQFFDVELTKDELDLITGLTGVCGESKDPDQVPF